VDIVIKLGAQLSLSLSRSRFQLRHHEHGNQDQEWFYCARIRLRGNAVEVDVFAKDLRAFGHDFGHDFIQLSCVGC
jgi:hypothetical protein